MSRACGGSSARNSSKLGLRGLERFSMAEEAATAEEEEGEIQEDQKLEPSRDGESAGLRGGAVEVVGLEEVDAALGGSGGSTPCVEAASACDDEDDVAELIVSCQLSARQLYTGV